MPIIERECTHCHYSQEDIENRETADKETIECPECKEEALTRKISASSFVLTGKNWFKDGY